MLESEETMRGSHFSILFVILLAVIFLSKQTKIEELNNSTNQKNNLDTALENAVDAGTMYLLKEDGRTLDKEKAEEQYFYTLAACLGILDQPTQMELLKLYTPVLCVTTEKGFYLSYNDEYERDGGMAISKRWSERIPYSYEDETFIYNFTMGDQITIYDKNQILPGGKRVYEMDYHEFQTEAAYENFRYYHPNSIVLNDEQFLLTKRQAIIQKIEEFLAIYTNRNNYIAEHFGITYTFALPVIDDSEILRSIEDISLIVIFQGVPYSNGRDIYNSFAVAGAELQEKETFYVMPKDWYFVYHRVTCPQYTVGEEIGVCHGAEECAVAGAYACEICCPEGKSYKG